MSKYYSVKTYGNDRGLSCCFRQWRASHSHCSTLHGYSIGIKLVFECETLDDKNWCMDFGGLKSFKSWADWMFDHTLIIAKDDPHFDFFHKMSWVGDPPHSGMGQLDERQPFERGALCDLRIVEGVGCEMFAKMCYDKMVEIITTKDSRYPINPNVRVKSVEVFEHGANSAIYEG